MQYRHDILQQVLPELLGSDPEIAPAARSYFCTVAFFFPFSMASALYSSILRCSGNILLPSIMNVGMCVFDVIFNFIFIYPPRDIGGFHVWGAGLGVQGAALGTGLAQACVAVTRLLGIICRRGPLRFQGNETWRFTKPCMNNMLRLSTPTALEVRLRDHDLRLHPGIFHGALNVRLRALPHQPPDS